MDKKELKGLLRPIVKELIKETLAEYGAAALMAEAKITTPVEQKVIKKDFENTYRERVVVPSVNTKTAETKKRMDEELKRAGLLSKQFNPFSGTKALTESQAAAGNADAPAASPYGPPGGLDPTDPGIDISGIMNMASGKWAAHMGGKK
jgi:hypothetical protein